MIDLNDLDAVSASDTPFKLAIINADGSESGVVLHVLGSQSDKVQSEINRMVNDRRKKQAAAQGLSRTGVEPVTPIEDDIAFGHRLTAVRVVGWDGIKQDWSAETAFRLVSRNADVAKQVLDASNDVGNFMQSKAKGS